MGYLDGEHEIKAAVLECPSKKSTEYEIQIIYGAEPLRTLSLSEKEWAPYRNSIQSALGKLKRKDPKEPKDCSYAADLQDHGEEIWVCMEQKDRVKIVSKLYDLVRALYWKGIK
jgi:hypothetical protein